MKGSRSVIESVVKTVYIADDGTEYDTLADCKERDRELAQMAAEHEVYKLPHFKWKPDYADYSDIWEWFFVQNAGELKLVQEAKFSEEAVAWDAVIDTYPAWVLTIVDEPNGCGVIFTAEEHFTLVKKYLDEIYGKIRETSKQFVIDEIDRVIGEERK